MFPTFPRLFPTFPRLFPTFPRLLEGFLKVYNSENRKFQKTELKPEFSKSDVFSIRQGVDFCGYRHFDNFVLLRKSTKTRERRKIEEIKRLLRDGDINKNTARASIDSILGWIRHAKTKNLKRSLDVLNLRQFISSI